MKILITGGHVTPALVIIDKLVKDAQNSLVFVGREYASDSSNSKSFEFHEINKRKVKFIHLEAGRLSRIFSLSTVKDLYKFPIGLYHAFRIIGNEKPDIILSFGGYIALPIVLAGYIFKISIYTHEQTIRPGLANKIIGLFARKIFVAFPQAAGYFEINKTIVTGNPIRESIFKIIKKPFTIQKTKPVIYITGGSLGSHSINIHIANILPELLKKYIVIQQTGDAAEYRDYEKILEKNKQLLQEQQKNFFPRKHFFEDEIGYIYNICDLVIGRSGANTFFEMIALKKPAIFIPLPWSANQEQQEHAKIFKEAQTGEIFDQKDTSENLSLLIDLVMANLGYYSDNFNKLNSYYEKFDANSIIQTISV